MSVESSLMGFSAFIKEPPESSLFPFCHVKTQGEDGYLWTRNQPRYLPAKPLSLQNWDINRCCLQATQSTVSVTAAWTDSDTSLTSWLLKRPCYQEDCVSFASYLLWPPCTVPSPLLSLPLNSTDALRPSSRPTFPDDCPFPVISPLTQFQHFLFILLKITYTLWALKSSLAFEEC